MLNTSATAILAANLKQALDRHRKYQGDRAKLAKDAAVSTNSIMYMLHPERRTQSRKNDASPKLSIIDRVAHALDVEAWQLLHPDFPTCPVSKKEIELWKAIEADFAKLSVLQEERKDHQYLPPALPSDS